MIITDVNESVSSLVDNVGLYIPIPLALVTAGWTVVAATVPPFDGASVPVSLVPTSVVVVVPVVVGDIVSVDSIPEEGVIVDTRHRHGHRALFYHCW